MSKTATPPGGTWQWTRQAGSLLAGKRDGDGAVKTGGPRLKKVVVVPHDPRWADEFEAEVRRLRAVFGEEMLAVHHIGSTAIPGIAAKPIVDILPVVRSIERVDAKDDEMTALGYRAWGGYGLPW